jgi:hypothetical protein
MMQYTLVKKFWHCCPLNRKACYSTDMSSKLEFMGEREVYVNAREGVRLDAQLINYACVHSTVEFSTCIDHYA